MLDNWIFRKIAGALLIVAAACAWGSIVDFKFLSDMVSAILWGWGKLAYVGLCIFFAMIGVALVWPEGLP